MKKKILVGYLALCMVYVGAFSSSNTFAFTKVATIGSADKKAIATDNIGFIILFIFILLILLGATNFLRQCLVDLPL